MKRVINKTDRERFKKLKDFGCVLCYLQGYPGTPAEIHHVRTEVGWGRDGHQNTIPLCPYHHRGNYGVHGMGRSQFKKLCGYSEIDLLSVINVYLAR